MSSGRTGGRTTIDQSLREGDHEHNTPLEWVRPVAERLDGFDLDPCASASSDLADENIRNSGGLDADWSDYETVWCNHPYGRDEPEEWLEKAYECDARTVVTLSKGDTSTAAFGDYLTRADLLCFPNTASERGKGRIRFIGEGDQAKFPNVYGVFGKCPDELREWFESIGWVVVPGGLPADETPSNTCDSAEGERQ
jgi:hypothetical protein